MVVSECSETLYLHCFAYHNRDEYSQTKGKWHHIHITECTCSACEEIQKEYACERKWELVLVIYIYTWEKLQLLSIPTNSASKALGNLCFLADSSLNPSLYWYAPAISANIEQKKDLVLDWKPIHWYIQENLIFYWESTYHRYGRVFEKKTQVLNILP